MMILFNFFLRRVDVCVVAGICYFQPETHETMARRNIWVTSPLAAAANVRSIIMSRASAPEMMCRVVHALSLCRRLCWSWCAHVVWSWCGSITTARVTSNTHNKKPTRIHHARARLVRELYGTWHISRCCHQYGAHGRRTQPRVRPTNDCGAVYALRSNTPFSKDLRLPNNDAPNVDI